MCTKSFAPIAIFLFQLISNVCLGEIQLIEKNFFDNNSQNEGWLSWKNYQKVNVWKSSCGSSNILGGFSDAFQQKMVIYKTFDMLPPHYQISISLKFWRIDDWNVNDNFTIYVDNVLAHQYIYSGNDSSTNFCGSQDYFDSIMQINLVVDHFSTSSSIIMTAQSDQVQNIKGWGISEFELSVITCPYGCNSCDQYQCFNQELILQSLIKRDFTVQSQEGWYYNSGIVTQLIDNWCGFDSLQSPNDYLTKQFNLGIHFAISLQLKVAIFYVLTSKVDVEIDGILVSTSQLSRQVLAQNPACSKELILHQINLYQIKHTNSVLNITVRANIQDFYTSNNKFGIRDFQLYIKPDLDLDSCKDSNINPFDGCFNQQFSCVEGCSNCIMGICFQCQDGWQYISSMKHCVPICGDKKIKQNEECDDGNLIPYDGCHFCQFQCPQHCLDCQFGQYNTNQNQLRRGSINLNEYKVQKENSSFNHNFINFIDYSYYYLSQNYYDNLLNQRITRQTIIIHQNCNLKEIETVRFNNQNSIKIQNCNQQQFGQCLNCQRFYELSANKQICIPQCNDGMPILDEICDDKNNIQFDGCYKCQLNCDLNCLHCFDQKCLLCEYGWQLRDNKCYQICGDGLVALNSIEQCDDGNQIENDGCYDCLFECVPNCQLCLNNQVCLTCQYNFQLEGELCVPICGDGIIVSGFEECDDKNNLPYDGCFECQYQCQFGCLDCYNQQYTCKKCDTNYILNNITGTCNEIQIKYEENKDEAEKPINIRCNQNFLMIDYQCVNQCGNGILNGVYEQCDDGNFIGGDGCSFVCTEEEQYICKNYENSTSICSFYQYPDFKLYGLSSRTNNTQIIELTFTQKVKLIDDLKFENIAVITIIPKNNAAIYIKPIVNLSTTFDFPIYQIFIEFLEPIEDSYLQIDLAKSIIKNEYEFDLVKNSEQITLGKPFVLSENNQKKITQIVLLNDAMIYSMVSISGLSLLTGNAIMFFNLLDLLQSLSYIRYMQYSFPPHLIQFLNTYTKVSLKPIMDYLKIDELLSYFNGGILPLQKSKSQSQSQSEVSQLNQFYSLNAKSCYFSIFGSLVTFAICRILTSNKVQSYQQILFRKLKNNPKYLRIDAFFLHKIQILAFKFKNEYYSFGIAKIYLAILHQFLFSALLQFPNYSFNSPLMIFNSINAIIGLGCNLYISLQLLSITSSNYKDNQKWKYFYQDSKHEFWASNYRSFQIYRIMFYIFIIVEALNYPEIQSILLSMSSLFYLGYILKFRPMQSKYELGKLIFRELFFILITGSFLIYSFDLNYDQLLLFGWIHIGLFSSMLISNLIIDLIECINKAWQTYKKKQEIQRLKEVKKYYDNPIQKLILAENQKIPQSRH